MIDIKELMVGNWVQTVSVIGAARVITIDSDLDPDGDCMPTVDTVKKRTRVHWIPEQISPIPITAEILKANGWEERDKGTRYCKGNKSVLGGSVSLKKLEGKEKWIFSTIMGRITYVSFVHELQNILHAMNTGEDIEL